MKKYKRFFRILRVLWKKDLRQVTAMFIVLNLFMIFICLLCLPFSEPVKFDKPIDKFWWKYYIVVELITYFGFWFFKKLIEFSEELRKRNLEWMKKR